MSTLGTILILAWTHLHTHTHIDWSYFYVLLCPYSGKCKCLFRLSQTMQFHHHHRHHPHHHPQMILQLNISFIMSLLFFNLQLYQLFESLTLVPGSSSGFFSVRQVFIKRLRITVKFKSLSPMLVTPNQLRNADQKDQDYTGHH